MSKHSRSFFERLTGNAPSQTIEEELEEVVEHISPSHHHNEPKVKEKKKEKEEETYWGAEENVDEGQLTVDMFHKPNEIIIQAMLAGVKPEDLDVSITHDMITIKGSRKGEREASEENYYYKELYWGNFSRSILLPQEIDPDGADANLKNGILTIRLPKVAKERTQKLRIQTD